MFGIKQKQDYIWKIQVLPSSRESEGEGEDEEWWSSALGDGKTVVRLWQNGGQLKLFDILPQKISIEGDLICNSDSLPAWEHITPGWKKEKGTISGDNMSRDKMRKLELYFLQHQVLRSQDFHVVAPDYRGYADSSSHVRWGTR